MTGERDIDRLLAGMSARLDPETFVFVTLGGPLPPDLTPRMTFQEPEGTTLILPLAQAQAFGLEGQFPCRCITLEIHSALEAVGFIARIASELARHGMGVNPVAGYFHDHLFVPADRAEEAMAGLSRLSAG